MSIDQIINLLAAVTLIELMLSVGLGATLPSVRAVARDWGCVTRAMLANYLIVPAAAIGLVFLFQAQPFVAAGVMVVAVCPGAPYGPPFTSIARGDSVRAVGLMVILAGTSALLAPLLLQLLLPLVTGGSDVKADALQIVRTLAMTQFLPLCVGLWIATYRPALAKKLGKPMSRLAAVLGLTLIVVILIAQFNLLAEIRVNGYVGMLVLLIVSAAAGWLLAESGAAAKKTLSITTSVRNVGVGLVIAGGSFPGTPAVTFTTAYGIFQTVLALLAVLLIGRHAATSASNQPRTKSSSIATA